MHIINLASGSKANSTLVCYGQTKILIDAGLSERQLASSLMSVNEKLSNIQAVFITHEHIDHVRAIKSLAKKYDMEFFMHKKLADSGFFSDVVFKDGKLKTFENKVISFGGLEITPFETSHDAIRPVGFVVGVEGSQAKAGFVTDLGVVTEGVKQALVGTKIVFLESNYDEAMLDGGFYPMLVKKRIAGMKGHLSNAQSLELAKFLYDGGTKCFVLSHISQNNNTYELAFANFVDYFESNNIKLNKDVFVRVSFQDKHGNNFELKEDFNGK